MRTLLIPLLLVVACGADTPTNNDTTETDPVAWSAPESGVIQLTTRDDVTLEADYQAAASEGAPAVILVHMIPPSNTRADWPQAFRDQLHAKGWTILNLDRRGAGGSGGVAQDAYQGEAGKYDVEAAAKKIAADGYGKIAILGASNGTTSMIDYAAWASSEGLPEPVGLGFLSGGAYTETQTAMSTVPKVPAAFLYPPNESAWPEAQRGLDPVSWTFTAYAQGAHGTRLFTTGERDAVTADLDAFLTGVLSE